MKPLFSRTYYLLVSFIILTSEVYAQNELWYAIEIQKNATSIKANAASFPDLAAFVNDPFANPEISSDSLKRLLDFYMKPKHAFASPAGIITSGLALSPKISEEVLLTAITDVIIDRAKQELALAYFDRLATSFETEKLMLDFGCATNEVTLNKLFPSFYMMIKNSQASMNMQIGSTMVMAVKRDVINLHQSIDEYLIPPCYKRMNSYTLYRYSYDLHEKFKAGKNIVLALRELQPEINAGSNESEHIINLITVISESMLGKNTLSWINLNPVDNDDYSSVLTYYLSLLYRNGKLKSTFAALNLDITDNDREQYFHSFLLSFHLFQSVQSYLNSVNSNSTASHIIAGTAEPSQIASTIENRHYETQVISDLLSVIDIYCGFIVDQTKKEQLQKGLKIANELIAFYTSIANKNYSEAILSTLTILDQYIPLNQLSPQIVQFMTLAADISQAENVEQAKNILDAAILPVGSYKIKRSVAFSSSLNAYLGANSGVEMLDYKELKDNSAFYIGPFLPIGVDLSWSKGTERKLAHSHTVHISLIDLGVLAGYRFMNSSDSLSVESVPKIKFEHVISPGIFYVSGFKNSPISVGAGAQYTPRLRAVTDDSIVLNLASSLRFTAFIAVDIPLLTLSIRGKKQQVEK